jgi:hypothetical protein
MGGGAPIPGPPIPCTAPGGRIPMAPAGGPPIIGGPPGLPLCVGAPICAGGAPGRIIPGGPGIVPGGAPGDGTRVDRTIPDLGGTRSDTGTRRRGRAVGKRKKGAVSAEIGIRATRDRDAKNDVPIALPGGTK